MAVSESSGPKDMSESHTLGKHAACMTKNCYSFSARPPPITTYIAPLHLPLLILCLLVRLPGLKHLEVDTIPSYICTTVRTDDLVPIGPPSVVDIALACLDGRTLNRVRISLQGHDCCCGYRDQITAAAVTSFMGSRPRSAGDTDTGDASTGGGTPAASPRSAPGWARWAPWPPRSPHPLPLRRRRRPYHHERTGGKTCEATKWRRIFKITIPPCMRSRRDVVCAKYSETRSRMMKLPSLPCVLGVETGVVLKQCKTMNAQSPIQH